MKNTSKKKTQKYNFFPKDKKMRKQWKILNDLLYDYYREYHETNPYVARTIIEMLNEAK